MMMMQIVAVIGMYDYVELLFVIQTVEKLLLMLIDSAKA
jgi:hypothetical protein